MNDANRSVAKRLQSASETGKALGGNSKEAAAMFTAMAFLHPQMNAKMKQAVLSQRSKQLSEMAEVVPKPYEPIDANVTPVENPGPTMSTQLLADARRAGLDLNTLAPDELDAFASGGVAGLTRYRRQLWDDEAAARPSQPGLMA